MSTEGGPLVEANCNDNFNGFENLLAHQPNDLKISDSFSNDCTNGMPPGSSSSANSSNTNKPSASLEYLQQLLKDKNQLSAFPNVFAHVERLIDEEINRIRIALFHCEFGKEPLTLPEPIGEVTQRQEKIFVPVKKFPEYNFVGRILGPRGMTAKQLEQETGCRIMVRGKGSIRDKKKEEQNRGKTNWEHLNEELHVLVHCEDTPNRIEVKINRAIDEVQKLLVPSPEGEDELKKKQLMELAIINGTYKNGPQQIPVVNSNVTNSLAKNTTAFLQPNMLGASLNPTIPSPGLAGTPLIMPSTAINRAHQAAAAAAQQLSIANHLGGINAIAQTQAALASMNNFPGMAAAAAANFLATPTTYGATTAGAAIPAASCAVQAIGAQQAPNSSFVPVTTTSFDYQQLLLGQQQQLQTLDATNALTAQLVQQQQQQQQQQLALAMFQAQNGAIVSTASTTNGFLNGADYNTANGLVLGAQPQSLVVASDPSSLGPISASRRYIGGQSREHPYSNGTHVKREGK